MERFQTLSTLNRLLTYIIDVEQIVENTFESSKDPID